jgi:hypothetical protein
MMCWHCGQVIGRWRYGKAMVCKALAALIFISWITLGVLIYFWYRQ